MGYEVEAKLGLELWKRKLSKKENKFQRMTKHSQQIFQKLIPEKVHHMMTESIKKMVQMTLVGSDYMTKPADYGEVVTLEEIEKKVQKKKSFYKKAAAVEGAGTGAGGLLLAMTDFPLLLSIKMKFLFDIAGLHGKDTKDYSERLFLLLVFQLAFSTENHRSIVLHTIENWSAEKGQLTDIDWRAFQQEYRDYIDFVKMLQLVPGIGAAVGAFANYRLLDHLAETAIYAYRIRWFSDKNQFFNSYLE